jgi:anti-anti-sigma factor
MKLTLDDSLPVFTWIRCDGDITQDQTFADPMRDGFGADIYAKKVVIDMTNARRVDSSGVSWLLGCQRRFREGGGSLTLCSVPPIVMDVFRVLSLDKSFQIVDRAEIEKLSNEGSEQ